jgi:pyridoxal phosphate enzyme (YggS family)
MTAENIAKNVAAVRERIASAAARAGRAGSDVRLIAVSKTRTTDEIMAALEAAVYEFGENKVQEITSKYDIMSGFTENSAKNRNIKWHMIGHLQRNKVKYIADKVCLIHSVDSLRLAEEIDRRAKSIGSTIDVLLQINAGAEQSKSGISADDVKQLACDIAGSCGNLVIKGLMAVVPAVDDPGDVRRYFSDMKALYDAVGSEYRSEAIDFEWLSMGMTHDYEVAIEEGANIVRVGTGIFGPRAYQQGM